MKRSIFSLFAIAAFLFCVAPAGAIITGPLVETDDLEGMGNMGGSFLDCPDFENMGEDNDPPETTMPLPGGPDPGYTPPGGGGVTMTVTPEPSTMILMAAGLAGLVGFGTRRNRR